MANLSIKELKAIEDGIKFEQTLIKKYTFYASICTDPQIKTKCEQIAAKHENHAYSLLNILNQ